MMYSLSNLVRNMMASVISNVKTLDRNLYLNVIMKYIENRKKKVTAI